jgi:FdhD protein
VYSSSERVLPVNRAPEAAEDSPEAENPTDLEQASVEVTVWRWTASDAGVYQQQSDRLAEEIPLAILYDDEPYAVMLGTPHDLQDFVTGFSVTEGIVPDASALLSFSTVVQPEGIELHARLDPALASTDDRRERSLAGRTGCGLCGVRALASAVRFPPPVQDTLRLSPEVVDAALAALGGGQQLRELTGSVHAAAWFSRSGVRLFTREDVGRHNALDKLLGAILRAGVDTRSGFVVVSSRASYEMVQKAAQCGVQMLVAVSAPTAMARRVAQSCGMTLVAFARSGRHTIYSHPHRLAGLDTGIPT